MATSRHDTYALSEFFNKFIYDYKMLYPNENLVAKILMGDFSWAQMHAGN